MVSPDDKLDVEMMKNPLVKRAAPVYHISLITCLIVIWIAGAVVSLTRLLFRIFRFGRLLRFAAPTDRELQSIVSEQAGRMKLRQIPDVLILPGSVSPMLWTLRRRAALLLPKQLLEELSTESLETVVVHELAHYHRRDHWVRGLEMLVTCLFWWHPLVWLAVRELRQV
jgi:beta-lactamase regulating signal transducer with metallopeptidase domain